MHIILIHLSKACLAIKALILVEKNFIRISNFLSVADINECDLGTDNCSSNGFCNDTIGSYDCTCSNGYSGDGFTCEGMFP